LLLDRSRGNATVGAGQLAPQLPFVTRRRRKSRRKFETPIRNTCNLDSEAYSLCRKPCPTRKLLLLLAAVPEGLGSYSQRSFTPKDFRVFATSRRLETMKDLSALAIETLALNLTDLDAIRREREDIATKTRGKIDILVNNAGKRSLTWISLPCGPFSK